MNPMLPELRSLKSACSPTDLTGPGLSNHRSVRAADDPEKQMVRGVFDDSDAYCTSFRNGSGC